MLFSQAEEIVHRYVALFKDSSITSKIARYETLLPCSKETLVQAYKVYMCFVGTFRTANKSEVNALFDLLNKMNSFIDKEEADHLNLLNQRFLLKQDVSAKEIKYFGDYLETSLFNNEHDEVLNVLTETQEFLHLWVVKQDRNLNEYDYYAHLYENLIGIPYKEEYGDQFYEIGMLQFNKGIE